MIDTQMTKPQGLPANRTKTQKRTAVAVRRAKRSEAAAIAAICRLSFAAAHHEAFHEPDLASYLADAFNPRQIRTEMAVRQNIFLIAETAGEIVGVLRLKQGSPPPPIQLVAPIEVSRLYLHPEHFGQGIGSTLMLQALGTAVAIGAKSCWLGVWQRNRGAIKFYTRWGFQPIGTDRLTVGQSSPLGLIMTRSL